MKEQEYSPELLAIIETLSDEQLDQAKTNWTAIAGCPKWKQKLFSNESTTVYLDVTDGEHYWAKDCFHKDRKDDEHYIYRLHRDFKRPEKVRFLLWGIGTDWSLHKSDSPNAIAGKCMEELGPSAFLRWKEYKLVPNDAIELNQAEAEYVQNPPAGAGWELRAASWGDEYKPAGGCVVTFEAGVYNPANSEFISGWLYCRARQEEKKGEWVEYDIYSDNGFWSCDVIHLNLPGEGRLMLYELPSIVGFGGVQFDGQRDKSEWNMTLSMCIGPDRFLFSSVCEDAEYKPATPINARFYIDT